MCMLPKKRWIVLGVGLSIFLVIFSIQIISFHYEKFNKNKQGYLSNDRTTPTSQMISQTITTTNVTTSSIEETTVTTTKETSTKNVVTVQRIIDVPTTSEFRRIVNKKHPLPSDYNPGENPVAKAAFLKLKEAMQRHGFAVSDQYSGFRSYAYQKKIFEKYVAQDGRENAERYSARPGYSEHQLGLAFDFIDTSGNLLGDGIKDGATEWLAKNAHLYGFVVRYVSGKEHITGYMPETWHVRFIGNDALEVYQSGLTLEEFYGVEGGGYLD